MSQLTNYIVRIKFTSPFRFGADNSGVGIEDAQPFFHSDTLFSSLCNAWARFGILDNDELISCGEKFLLSSSFIYVYKDSAVYFVPKPLISCCWLKGLQCTQKEQLEKLIKKAHWVTSDMFMHWLNSNPPDCVFPENPRKLSERLDYGSLFREQIVVKHAQDRLTGACNLFYENQFEFKEAPSCGLYFFVTLKDHSFQDKFNLGLKALSQTGLGGERNFGLGRFEVDNANGVLIPIEKDGSDLEFLFEDSICSHRCLFSLSLPTQSEINQLASNTDSQIAQYDIVLRKGWTFSSVNMYQMKRQSIYMFSEGSVFSINRCPVGRIEDLAPLDDIKNTNFPHPIFRFGKSFSVPLKSY